MTFGSGYQPWPPHDAWEAATVLVQVYEMCCARVWLRLPDRCHI